MTNKIKIIYTAGTWDLFHIGHLNLIKKAKELGDYLIVGVSTDTLIKQYKKVSPIMNYEQRKEIVESITYVDKVIKQSYLIDIYQFQDIKADLFVIGDDWENRTDISGLNWLKRNKKVKFIPYTKELSTTKIKNKIIKEWRL